MPLKASSYIFHIEFNMKLRWKRRKGRFPSTVSRISGSAQWRPAGLRTSVNTDIGRANSKSDRDSKGRSMTDKESPREPQGAPHVKEHRVLTVPTAYKFTLASFLFIP